MNFMELAKALKCKGWMLLSVVYTILWHPGKGKESCFTNWLLCDSNFIGKNKGTIKIGGINFTWEKALKGSST